MLFRGGVSKVVGIDIGSYAVKIAGIRPGLGPKVEFFDVINIPEKPDAAFLGDAVGRVLKKHGAVGADIRLSVSDESVHIRRLELPSMPEYEMLEALRWQIKDRLAFDIDKALLDFKQLRETQEADGSRMADIIFAAVSKDSVDKKLGLFKKTNLRIMSMNVSPFALENFIKACDEIDASQTVLVIDLGHSKTDISFYKNKTLQFVRTISIAAGDITAALRAPIIVVGSDKLGLSTAEAEAIKHLVGVPYESMRLEKGITSIQVLTLIRGTLERMSKELKRSVEYYISEVGGEGISHVYLAGAGALLKNLDKYLGEELNLPVSRLEMPKAMAASGCVIPPEAVPSIACAIGAALNTTKKVNVLPQEHRLKKVEAVEMVSIRMISIIMGVVLALSYLVVKLRVDDYGRRVKNASAHKSILGQVREINQKIDQRERLLGAVNQGALDIEYVMKALSNLMPQGVVLSSLTIDPKGKTMEMSGIVYEEEGKPEVVLTHFMEALERSACFKEAQLGGIQQQSSEEGSSASFSISCQLE